MTGAKHTPGPWMCPTKNAAKHGFPRWDVGHQDGDFLGSIARVSAKSTPDERQANARLIAAAPDLLAALNMLALDVAALKTRYGETQQTHGEDLARAAIAKAEGRADD